MAMISQFLFLIPSLKAKKYKYQLTWRNTEYLKQMLFLSIPIIIGGSINQINILVDRTIASRITTGGIAALLYANKINLFIDGIVVIPLVSVMYPKITRMFNSNKMDDLKKKVDEVIIGINLLTIPAMVGLMIFSEPLVKMIYGRGAFDFRSINMTSSALFFYAIGLLGFGLREVLARVFYSLQDTKTPMLNATIAIILNIVLNIVLSKFMGIAGLALATSISGIFCTILLFINLRTKFHLFNIKKITTSFLKILLASLLMGAITKLSFNYLTVNVFSQNLSLFVAIFTGIIVYFYIIYFLKIDSVDTIVNAIKVKIKRNMK